MGLAALVGLGVVAKPAIAAVTTEQSASILVFPKVIADGTRDTIIQITNTSNNMRHAHCFYVNGALTNPDLPPSQANPPLCVETDFDIWLTKQQPTHWVVSKGRKDFPGEATCRGSATNSDKNCDPSTTGNPTATNSTPADCCDAGADPGFVPPVVDDFVGELKCIETDETGAPVGGNALKGEATLEDKASGDVSKYNAIGLKGFDNNNMDGVLCIGDGTCAGSTSGKEYEGCPQTWILDSPSIGAPDPVVEQQGFCEAATSCTSSVTTNLTVVPCTEDLENQVFPPTLLQFQITNEFEQTFSASTTIGCFGSFTLTDVNPVFGHDKVGGAVLVTKMRPGVGTPRGVFAVLEETHTTTFTIEHTTTTLVARNAQNAHTSFQDRTSPTDPNAVADVFTIPDDQIHPPQ